MTTQTMQTPQTTQSVFSGLKVVEIASFIAAPAAATMLSDFGADVIKVEAPGLGDPQRLLSSVPPSPAAPGNYSWHLANRNKRGVSVDLKSEGGTEILKRLVQWADVVITNFPHGTRESLHLGYEEVSGWNPRVVYADITGFGDAGPDARLPGFDLTAFWSRSGLLASTRDAGAPPTSPPGAVAITPLPRRSTRRSPRRCITGNAQGEAPMSARRCWRPGCGRPEHWCPRLWPAANRTNCMTATSR